MRSVIRFVLAIVLFSSPVVAGPVGTPDKTVSVGFFEAGEYPAHAALRYHYRRQLTGLMPDGYTVTFPPNGFKSASWNRDSSRVMAAELAADRSIDMVLAIGPWTVEDLLAAGFDRPIIAAFRFAPELEGLLDSTGRPIVPNLTVRVRTRKIETDLKLLTQLTKVRKLGVLIFPADTSAAPVIDSIASIGKREHFEVITAEGYDLEGTYAFFKAYNGLKDKVDALYVSPMWGCNDTKIRQFMNMAMRDRIDVLSSQGQDIVELGALVGGGGEDIRAAALYYVWKTIRIMQGDTPADLPVAFPEQPGWAVNEFAATVLGAAVDNDLWLSADVVEGPPGEEVERLSLLEAVDRALTQNPGYLARYDVLAAAAAAAGEAWSEYLPQIGLDAAAFHFDDNTVHNDNRYDNDRYRASLVLRQSLLSLETVRTIELASRHRDLARIDQQQAALDLELGVVIAYANYLQARYSLLIESAHRNRVEGCLQLARVEEKLDITDVADALRLEDQWLRATQSVAEAKLNLKIARILLNTLLGRPGETPFVLEESPFDQDRIYGVYSRLRQLSHNETEKRHLVDFLVSQLLATNPIIERDRAELALRQTRLARNMAGFTPQVGLQASFNLADEWSTTPWFEEEHATWSVGATLDLPLFLGGKRFKERRRLKAELSEQQYRRDNTYFETTARLEVQLERLLELILVRPLTARSAELATQYVDMIIDGYEIGQRPMADLIDGLNRDRDAHLEAIAIQFNYFEAVARLVNQVGWCLHESGRLPDDELLTHLQGLPDQGD